MKVSALQGKEPVEGIIECGINLNKIKILPSPKIPLTLSVVSPRPPDRLLFAAPGAALVHCARYQARPQHHLLFSLPSHHLPPFLLLPP